jgi:hypothetical protein
MQSKSTRGVQHDDVWAAADALIAEGLRPTIERVRQKIGRGSPNTVSPMLEGWFATLGPRLGVGDEQKTVTGGLPIPVQNAVAKLWDVAMLAAQGVADQGLLQAQQALTAENAAIELRNADLTSREHLLNERQGAIDEALQVARGQIADLTLRLEQSHAMSIRRDGEIDALRAKLSASDSQRMVDQERYDQDAKHHAEERQRLEDHSTITERRLMTEVDRERQEVKRLKVNLNDAERLAENAAKQWQDEKQEIAQRLRDLEIELHSERQAVVLANSRATELRALLDDQRIANGTALAQLSQVLSAAARKTPALAKIKKQVRSKALRPTS